jgi:hypothetical protein
MKRVEAVRVAPAEWDAGKRRVADVSFAHRDMRRSFFPCSARQSSACGLCR